MSQKKELCWFRTLTSQQKLLFTQKEVEILKRVIVKKNKDIENLKLEMEKKSGEFDKQRNNFRETVKGESQSKRVWKAKYHKVKDDMDDLINKVY